MKWRTKNVAYAWIVLALIGATPTVFADPPGPAERPEVHDGKAGKATEGDRAKVSTANITEFKKLTDWLDARNSVVFPKSTMAKGEPKDLRLYRSDVKEVSKLSKNVTNYFVGLNDSCI